VARVPRLRHRYYATDASLLFPFILALIYLLHIATTPLKPLHLFVMALLARFYVRHPMSISHLCLTGEYLLASTASGNVNVLDLHCRHTERSNSCEHRTTIEVGEMWDFDCYQNMLVTANNDHLVRVWDASTG
jgi:WD40 repeat protein